MELITSKLGLDLFQGVYDILDTSLFDCELGVMSGTRGGRCGFCGITVRSPQSQAQTIPGKSGNPECCQTQTGCREGILSDLSSRCFFSKHLGSCVPVVKSIGSPQELKLSIRATIPSLQFSIV